MDLSFDDKIIYIGTFNNRHIFLIKLEEEIISFSGMIINYLPYYISTGRGTSTITKNILAPFFGISRGFNWGQRAGDGWFIKCCIAREIFPMVRKELDTMDGIESQPHQLQEIIEDARYSNIFNDYYKEFKGCDYDILRKVCSNSFLNNVITNPDTCNYDTMLEATCEYIINEKEIKKYEQIYDDTKDIKTDLINNLIGINNIFGVDYKIINKHIILPEDITSLIIDVIKTKTNDNKLKTEIAFHIELFNELSILLLEKEKLYEQSNIKLLKMREKFASIPNGDEKKKLLVEGKEFRKKTNELLLEINHIKCNLITSMSYIKTYKKWIDTTSLS